MSIPSSPSYLSVDLRILADIHRHADGTMRERARRLGVTERTVNVRVMLMREAGHIQATRVGRMQRLSLSVDYRMRRLVRAAARVAPDGRGVSAGP